MHKAIDLGKKWDDDAPVVMSDLKDRVHYPDFHISNTDEARLLDIPDEGEATIKFKVVHRSHSEEDRNGKKKRRCSLTIEVQKIDFEDNPKPAKKKDSDGGARKAFSDYFKDK
jgi:hypothetical protein